MSELRHIDRRSARATVELAAALSSGVCSNTALHATSFAL
jgi:hypothetical protein